MKRRTLKAYEDLYRNPGALDSKGTAQTILFPNGEKEIWVRGTNGHGMALTIGQGPYGLSLRVRSFVGTVPMTVRCESGEVSIVQYDQTDTAQAFSRWYDDAATEADIDLLGPSYRRAQ